MRMSIKTNKKDKLVAYSGRGVDLSKVRDEVVNMGGKTPEEAGLFVQKVYDMVENVSKKQFVVIVSNIKEKTDSFSEFMSVLSGVAGSLALHLLSFQADIIKEFEVKNGINQIEFTINQLIVTLKNLIIEIKQKEVSDDNKSKARK